MKLENRYAPPPRLTAEQINEYACTLAKERGMRDRWLLNLIRWPAWASPPTGDIVLIYGEYVKSLKAEARAILTAQMAALPRVRIKRYKRRKKPDRKRYWTRRSTKHGKRPPPRRRGYLPPVPEKQAQPPPGQRTRQEEPSGKRPSRREREPLLFDVPGISRTLFLEIPKCSLTTEEYTLSPRIPGIAGIGNRGCFRNRFSLSGESRRKHCRPRRE